MTFVTLKTGSKERRLEKQVPTTEPATGADGSIIIYVRAERALSASHAYAILRDEEGFYVPAADPTLGTGLCLHVGVATIAAAVGDYVPLCHSRASGRGDVRRINYYHQCTEVPRGGQHEYHSHHSRKHSRRQRHHRPCPELPKQRHPAQGDT